jgi:hypothetical protein
MFAAPALRAEMPERRFRNECDESASVLSLEQELRNGKTAFGMLIQ